MNYAEFNRDRLTLTFEKFGGYVTIKIADSLGQHNVQFVLSEEEWELVKRFDKDREWL